MNKPYDQPWSSMRNHDKPSQNPPPGFWGHCNLFLDNPRCRKVSGPNLQKWGGPGGRSQARTGLTVHPGDCVAIDESGNLFWWADMAVNNWKAADGSAGDDFFLKMRTAPIFWKILKPMMKAKSFLTEVYTKPEKSHEGSESKKKSGHQPTSIFQWYPPYVFIVKDMSRTQDPKQLMVSMVKIQWVPSDNEAMQGQCHVVFFDSQMVEVGSSSPRTNCPWKKFKECILPQKSVIGKIRSREYWENIC